MAVGHPGINQCSNIRLRPIHQTHSLLAMQTSKEGEVKQQLEVQKVLLWHSRGGKILPKDLANIPEYSAKVVTPGWNPEPNHLIYFEPVGPCSLWGSAHILHFSHKQMKHLSTPVKGMVAVSVTNLVYHEIVSHGELFLENCRICWSCY